MKRGEYVSTNSIYGYQKGVSGQWEIDEEVAEYVRFIFAMAKDGKNTNEIKLALFEKEIPTPAEYKSSKGKHYYDISRTNNLWSTTKILRILRDERYTGTYVMGKTEVVTVGSHNTKAKDRSQWHIIPDHHPALIEKEVFLEIQEMFPLHSMSKKEVISYPLKSKVVCGHCRHLMQRKRHVNPVFFCRTSANMKGITCSDLEISEQELEEVVFISMKNHIVLACAFYAKEVKQDEEEQVLDIIQLKEEKRVLYEKFVMADISLEEYKSEKTVLDRKIESWELNEKNLTNRNSEEKEWVEKSTLFRRLKEEIETADSLTRELVELLISSVEVYKNDEIQINWSFDCPFMDILNKIERGE